MAKVMVPPVFFKANDVTNYRNLNEFEVYSSVTNLISTANVIGCQRIGGLWRVYLKTKEDRIKLITNKLTIRNQLIGVYNENPFRTGVQSPDDQIVKITIKGIPLSKDNSAIESYFATENIVLTRPVQYGQIRNEITKELTDCYSGDRIVYTKPFDINIPRTMYFGNSKANVYYDGQKLIQREMLCTNCYSTDHFRSRCENPPSCKSCRKPGHKSGDEECDALRTKPHKQVTAFQGKDDIMSNFYPCQINCHGILAKSSEHAYQYVKAIRQSNLEIAKNIKDAPTAFHAKQAAKKLNFDPNWQNDKEEVMKDILKYKCDQVPEFKQSLIDSKSNTLVEAVIGDLFWGSGLDKETTLMTKKTHWFGQNKMGYLLENLRTSVLESFQLPRNSKKNKQKKHSSISDEVQSDQSC